MRYNPLKNILPGKLLLFQLCLSAYFLFIVPPIFAQGIDNLHFEKVQEEGLSNNAITCINQDTNGFIWFGTREGLFRYDGYNYKAFRNFPGDPTTLVNNGIQCIYPDNNKLWIGTFGGLSCLDIGPQKIKNIASPELLQVFAVVPKDSADFWVGTSAGLFQFNKKTAQWKRVPALGKEIFITSICDDKKDHLYITTKNDFYCYNTLTGDCKHYQPDLPTYPKVNKKFAVTFNRSIIARDGNIWMSTWGCGLVRFNPQTQKIRSWCALTNDTHSLPYLIAFDLLEDDNGNIWIANQGGGLTIFEPAKSRFTNYPVDWKSENKLSRDVMSLFRDKSGIFWIGTEEGIFKYDPHSIYLSKTDVLLKTGKGLTNAYISPLSLLKDRNGVWWYGAYSGLYILDTKTGVLKECNQLFGIPQHSPVFDIIEDAGGTIWLNAKNTLVKIYKKTGVKSNSYQVKIFKSPYIQSNLYTLCADHENRIWIGTHSDGIFRFDQQTEKFISYHYNVTGTKDKINEIRTFCELSKDSLLIGGDQTGLFLLHTNNLRYEKIGWNNMARFTVDASINTIYKQGNDLWIGTEFEGLWRTDSHLKKPVIETINDGLPSMNITDITGDKKNNLWLLTNAGAAKFNIPGKKITVFDKKDGISSFGELSSIIADDDGNITIGGVGCIYNFNPLLTIKNKLPPEVFITNLRVFDKEYPIDKGKTINLNYNQNYFSFDFVALNYTQSKLNKYAYEMEGLDKRWNNAGQRRYVSYANLDEGTYIFKVKACNSEGIWNNIPAKLTLVISPPFWHRWWFYLLIAAVVVSALYIVYLYNIKQLKIRLQLRDDIARDFHDELGSTLSSIALYSEMAMTDNFANTQRTKSILSLISESSRSTVSAMQDMIWTIQPKNDSMQEIVYRMREYAYPLAELKNISLLFNVEEEMQKLVLNMDTRKNIYLIFKEALNNAFKYASASCIIINMRKQHNLLYLEIKDDGAGFDLKGTKTGNGLRNMHKRAAQAGGILFIESYPQGGTKILFNCPVN